LPRRLTALVDDELMLSFNHCELSE